MRKMRHTVMLLCYAEESKENEKVIHDDKIYIMVIHINIHIVV